MEKLYLVMISIGENITSSSDELRKVEIADIVEQLRNPSANIPTLIRQLRIVKEIDTKKYAALKRQLPYFVCGVFNPSFRKSDYFAYTEYFVVDIDHLTEKGFDIDETRRLVELDSRVVMSFVSPSEDGLKVVFKLKERCYDRGVYSLFYKSFLVKFSSQYALQQVVDSRTSDVTRACFMSVDPDVYYNSEAECVDMNAYVELDCPWVLLEEKRKQESVEKKEQPILNCEEKGGDPDRETMARIRQMLNPKAKKEKPDVYVPKELEDIEQGLKIRVEELNVSITEIINIQYGKKFRFSLGMKQAEINLFFGKRGFTVVQSPRSGTDVELNGLMADVVKDFVNNMS